MNQTQTTAMPKLFIGMDVHEKIWTVHFKTDLFDNKKITIPTDRDVLINYVEKHFDGIRWVAATSDVVRKTILSNSLSNKMLFLMKAQTVSINVLQPCKLPPRSIINFSNFYTFHFYLSDFFFNITCLANNALKFCKRYGSALIGNPN